MVPSVGVCAGNSHRVLVVTPQEGPSIQTSEQQKRIHVGNAYGVCDQSGYIHIPVIFRFTRREETIWGVLVGYEQALQTNSRHPFHVLSNAEHCTFDDVVERHMRGGNYDKSLGSWILGGDLHFHCGVYLQGSIRFPSWRTMERILHLPPPEERQNLSTAEEQEFLANFLKMLRVAASTSTEVRVGVDLVRWMNK